MKLLYSNLSISKISYLILRSRVLYLFLSKLQLSPFGLHFPLHCLNLLHTKYANWIVTWILKIISCKQNFNKWQRLSTDTKAMTMMLILVIHYLLLSKLQLLFLGIHVILDCLNLTEEKNCLIIMVMELESVYHSSLLNFALFRNVFWIFCLL